MHQGSAFASSVLSTVLCTIRKFPRGKPAATTITSYSYTCRTLPAHNPMLQELLTPKVHQFVKEKHYESTKSNSTFLLSMFTITMLLVSVCFFHWHWSYTIFTFVSNKLLSTKYRKNVKHATKSEKHKQSNTPLLFGWLASTTTSLALTSLVWRARARASECEELRGCEGGWKGVLPPAPHRGGRPPPPHAPTLFFLPVPPVRSFRFRSTATTNMRYVRSLLKKISFRVIGVCKQYCSETI